MKKIDFKLSPSKEHRNQLNQMHLRPSEDWLVNNRISKYLLKVSQKNLKFITVDKFNNAIQESIVE